MVQRANPSKRPEKFVPYPSHVLAKVFSNVYKLCRARLLSTTYSDQRGSIVWQEYRSPLFHAEANILAQWTQREWCGHGDSVDTVR